MLRVNKAKTIVYSNGLSLINFPDEEIMQLKEKLTFENPAYKNALKFSRYNRVSIPPYVMYFEQKGNSFNVPIGTDISFLDLDKCKIKDYRVYSKIFTPEFKLTLRNSQEKAALTYLSNIYNNILYNNKFIIQLPTGKGKSILGLYIASCLSCKTLIVVHKDDLVTGWKKDIDLAFNKEVKSGLIKAKSRTVGDFITIATVQTLNKLSEEELEILYDTFGLVIQDEMHHCPASSYEVVSKFRAKYKLGLTATPERSDGLDHIMNLYYGGICYKYESDEAEEEKDILPVSVIRKNVPIYFNPVCQRLSNHGKVTYKIVDPIADKNFELKDNQKRITDIPYDSRPKIQHQYVDDIVVNNNQYQNIVCEDILQEFNEGHSIVVFFSLKEHCRKYRELLIQKGVPKDKVALYYGDNKDNNAVLDLAENNRAFITLTTYSKATEGTNVKQWEVEFLVSSINNGKNTEQAVGRIRRTKEGKLNPVRLYDYRFPEVYTLTRHGVTRDERYTKLGFIQKSPIFRRGFI